MPHDAARHDLPARRRGQRAETLQIFQVAADAADLTYEGAAQAANERRGDLHRRALAADSLTGAPWVWATLSIPVQLASWA